MFEDSLVESRVSNISAATRWTAMTSIALQIAIASAVIVLPLLHPESIAFRTDAPKVMLPVLTKPPAPVVRTQSAPAGQMTTAGGSHVEERPSLLPSLGAVSNEPPEFVRTVEGMGAPDGILKVVGSGAGNGPAVSVTPAKRISVSSGVAQGMLLAPIKPVYPAIAKAARVEGNVVVDAVISRTGTVESLHVISGPAMLQGAAIDAIRTARYRPFLLNGKATEVQVRITVNFHMNG